MSDRNWKMIDRGAIDKSDKIKLPSERAEAVIAPSLEWGDSVRWHLHHEKNYITLAERELSKEIYLFVDVSSAYNEGTRARIPGELMERKSITEGDPFMYVATEEMLDDYPRSMHLIFEDDFQKIMDDGDFRGSISDKPTFG